MADITYLPTRAGFLYLAVVVDAFSRRVDRWAMANQIRTELEFGALNIAKPLAADAASEVAQTMVRTQGGYGFAAEYNVERKVREPRLYQVAPNSTNLTLS